MRDDRPPGLGLNTGHALAWVLMFVVAIGLVAGVYLAFTPPLNAGSSADSCTGSSISTSFDSGSVARKSSKFGSNGGTISAGCFRASRTQVKLAAAIGLGPLLVGGIVVAVSRSGSTEYDRPRARIRSRR